MNIINNEARIIFNTAMARLSENGVTSKQVAKGTGISPAYLSHIATGKRRIGLTHALKLQAYNSESFKVKELYPQLFEMINDTIGQKQMIKELGND